jgi:FkbM family methyltransferase
VTLATKQPKRAARQARRALRKLLTQPYLSRPLTAAVRPWARFLGPQVLLHVPVNRIIDVRSPLCEEPVLLDARGSDPVASMLYWKGLDGWEPETLPVFLRLLMPGATVLDIGANTGLYSLFAARRSPTATVHAIEPVPRVFWILEENIARNKVSNVTCHRLALSNKRGAVTMYVPDDEVPVMASLVEGWRPGSARVEVDACTVDDLVARLGISNLDLIKIDTEGTEHHVVEGAMRTIRNQRPFIICEVLATSDTAGYLTGLLGPAGYEFFLLGKAGPRQTKQVSADGQGGSPNYLFVPRCRSDQARTLLGI